MEIEEETFPAVSSFEEESQEETEVPRYPVCGCEGAVAKPGVYELRKKSGFSGGGSRQQRLSSKPWNGW